MKKLIELKDHIRDEIDDSGGIGVFMTALVLTLIIWPFGMVYILILKPIYRLFRMLIDSPKLGIIKAFMKHFHPDQYKKEQWAKEREEEKALNSQLLPDSRQKTFEDWKTWPDAYVVDKTAVYAN